MPDNKIKYGLKNVNYAVQAETVLEGVTTISYGGFEPIPGAVNMTNAPVGEAVEFFADDILYFSEDTNSGYDGNIEMALVPDTFRIAVFGETLDDNGTLIENTNAKPKKIALAFEFDGDVNKTRHVLYSVKVSRPNIDSSTKNNTKKPATESMAYQARPRVDNGNIKAKSKQGTAGYSSFFNAVYEPVVAVTP